MGTTFNTYVLWKRTILAIINIVLPQHSAGVIFSTRVFGGGGGGLRLYFLHVAWVLFLVPVFFKGTCFSLHIPLDNMGVILSTPASLFG